MSDEVKTLEAEQKEKELSPAESATIEEMAKAGVLYGRKKSKTHPRMKTNIYATRSGMEVLDLVKTLANLIKAGEFLKETAKKGGGILIVGTMPASQAIVEEFAKKLGLLFVIKRWLGGTLTNFKTINQRIQYYINLKTDKAAGKLEKYTKKEQSDFDKEIARLSGFFSGLESMSVLPQAMVIIDTVEHEIALREAQRLNIPVVGIINTDSNPEEVAYPIPANSNAKTSVSWILNQLGVKIEEGAKERTIALAQVALATVGKPASK